METHVPPGQRDEKEEEDKKMALYYFDVIPWDALENVVRFLSGSPRAKDWRTEINASHIAPLFGSSSTARTYVCSQFNTVYASGKSHKFIPAEFQVDADKNIIWALKKQAILDLVAGGSEFITSLVINTNSIQNLHEALNNNNNKFPNLRRLSIRNIETANEAKQWLRKLGAQLEQLEIECFHPSNRAVLAVQKYCPQLRVLSLRALQENHVKNSGTALWKALGGSLRVLNVQFQFVNYAKHVIAIRKYCRSITRICLEEVFGHSNDDEIVNGNEAYADCIASYGDTLEHATVFDMTQEQLHRITSSCRAARFYSNISRAGRLFPTLNIIGGQLDKIYIAGEKTQTWDNHEGTHGGIAAAWAKCSSLRNFLMLDTLSVADMGRFMTQPKSILKTVYMCIEYGQDVKQFVDKLAYGTGSLQDVVLRCLAPPANAFDKLVAYNQALASVTIQSDTQLGIDGSDVPALILKSLLKAPAIHFLGIHDFHNPIRLAAAEKICDTHRHRRLCISVLGFNYLQ